MNEEIQKLYAQLNDVEGLQDVSMFPLAIGWWVLIVLLALVMMNFVFVLIRRQKYKQGWKYKIILELEALEKNFKTVGKKKTIAQLSEILKRAALLDYPREEVAKLIGKKWLSWLRKKDADKFNWVTKAEFLISAPYMREDMITAKKQEIFRAIEAAKKWVR